MESDRNRNIIVAIITFIVVLAIVIYEYWTNYTNSISELNFEFERLYPNSVNVHGPYVYCDGMVLKEVYIDYELKEIKEVLHRKDGNYVRCDTK